uniref:Uncharacterized protein n=1 Tax=Cucumis melo TaxID=3656 RepID=A0A9I9D8K6_CUCME
MQRESNSTTRDCRTYEKNDTTAWLTTDGGFDDRRSERRWQRD